MGQVFSAQIFFLVFRESMEASIIVSVLLAFLKQSFGQHDDPLAYRRLRRQVWLGAGLGTLVCMIIGGAFIGAWFTLGRDLWQGSEDIWEGVFCLVALAMITWMSLAVLRVGRMQDKWRIKLAQALVKTRKRGVRFYLQKYAMFALPFITCLREGLEAVVFVGGVSGLKALPAGIPLSVVLGLCAGLLVGVAVYYGGASASLQGFLVVATCFMYLLSAGLFSRAVWYFETAIFNKASGGTATENGSGPGTYDIAKSVWHVNCCHPSKDGGWNVFNALLGWQNSATYGLVILYNVYWIAVILVIFSYWYKEQRGYLPWLWVLSGGKLQSRNPFQKRAVQLSPEQDAELMQEALEVVEEAKDVAASVASASPDLTSMPDEEPASHQGPVQGRLPKTPLVSKP